MSQACRSIVNTMVIALQKGRTYSCYPPSLGIVTLVHTPCQIVCKIWCTIEIRIGWGAFIAAEYLRREIQEWRNGKGIAIVLRLM